MKLKKQGISLIVLIITIIILAILAAAIIINIFNTPIINSSKDAVYQKKLADLRDKIQLEINDKMLQINGSLTPEQAYNIIKAYDKSSDVNDKIGTPFIETADGIKMNISDVYEFDKEYLIQKEYPDALIVSPNSEFKTLEEALTDISNNTTDSEAMIYLNLDTVTWNAANDLISSSNTVIDKFIISGNSNTVFTVTGSDYDNITVANGATLEMWNLSIKDNTGSTSNTAWETAYLEFGGTTKFVNCNFLNGIQFTGDNVTAELVDCTFSSGNEGSIYNLWILSGNITIKNSTFYGKRYIKVHEAYGSEVSNVLIENCTFDLESSVKPCLALGTLNSNTSVTMKDNTIYYYSNSSKGDLDNYVYESDTDTSTFEYVEINNNLISGQ